jgi:glycerophosphoryl diester phosphodiesterase
LRLIAHRGGRGFGTDNTLDAMEGAVRARVPWIETDVRATADGQLMICHDSMIWGHIVGRTTYAELHKHAPERPLLHEVLERLAGWVMFNIEIKEADPAQVASMLDSYDMALDTVVTSFDWDIIEGYKNASASTVTGHLYRVTYNHGRKIRRCLEVGASVIAPYFSSVSRRLVDDAHDAGLEVCAWTVNDEGDFRKLHSWGVDSIITDHYLQMKELLRSLEAERPQSP